MTAAVATRRRAFQYSLMHRQNCENPETRGVITDTSWQARSTRYAHTVRETRRTRTRQVVCKGAGGLPLYALSIIVSRLNTACIPGRESRIRRGSPWRRSLQCSGYEFVSRERKNDDETRAEKRKRTEKAARKMGGGGGGWGGWGGAWAAGGGRWGGGGGGGGGRGENGERKTVRVCTGRRRSNARATRINALTVQSSIPSG